MPPKKAQQEKKKKLVEDKTFGLKNKNKSAKVKNYVEQVKQNADKSGNRLEREAAEKRKKEVEDKKRREEERKAELAELFKPVIQNQKVPFGVDPKTILCNFFKAGSCAKGSKCKFSHDLDVERKAAKINLYEDARDAKEKEDNMENWDQEQLEKAISQKHKTHNTNRPTEIVCKFFLEAIESRKYGWFWECPNGGSECKYRHALPPGYILKKKETPEEKMAREQREKENEITIEDFLETERHNLGPNLTPVTAESFKKWKAERKAREAADLAANLKKKQEEYKKMRAGMRTGMAFSGKELFDFNPDMAKDGDEDDGAMEGYEREIPDGEENLDGQEEKIKVWEVAEVALEMFEDVEGLDDDDSEDDSEDEDATNQENQENQE